MSNGQAMQRPPQPDPSQPQQAVTPAKGAPGGANLPAKTAQPPRKGPKKTTQLGGQRAFLSHSIVLEEGGTPRLMRMAVLAILVMITAFLLWSATAELKEVTSGVGAVIPSVPIQRIQHLEGGIISDIRVKEGDLVAAGSVLLVLDPTQAQSELEQLRVRLAGLNLQAERLRAFAAGRVPDFSIVPNAPASLILDQRTIYAGQIEAKERQRAVLEQQLSQRRTETQTLVEQQQRLRRSAALLDEELGMRQKLFDTGLNSRLVLIDINRRLNDGLGEVQRLQGEEAKTRQMIQEAEKRLNELDATLARDSLGQMGSLTAEASQINDAINKQLDKLARLTVTTPLRGYVKGMLISTIGGVVAPGAEVMQIVPIGDQMEVEARIQPRDIGLIKEGQRALIKVSAYDFSKFGGVGGQVMSLSATTFLDERQAPYYRARVVLDQDHVGGHVGHNMVVPGMTVQVDIPTGEKTLLEYLFRPIYLATHSAFSER